MKKIDFGELVNNTYSNEEVIEWLATASMSLTADLSSAIVDSNLGRAGVCAMTAGTLASVAKALNEKVNGKKEKTVL